jgi:hypothetical protein
MWTDAVRAVNALLDTVLRSRTENQALQALPQLAWRTAQLTEVLHELREEVARVRGSS